MHEEVAVLVHPAAVPRVEPPIAGVAVDAEVLTGHLVAAHPDLAELAVGHGVALGVADRQLDAGEDPTDRAQPGAHVGSSLAKASRWSSGPSTATVLEVSVRP